MQNQETITPKERIALLKAGIKPQTIEALYNAMNGIKVVMLPITKCEIRQW